MTRRNVAYDVLCLGQKHKKGTCVEFKKDIQALGTNTSSVRRLPYRNMLSKLHAVRQYSAARFGTSSEYERSFKCSFYVRNKIESR